MTSHTVTNTAQFLVSLSTAQEGDTIYLAPGTYDSILVRSLGNIGVTVTSLDSDNPAILTGVTMSDTSGVRFSEVVFESPADVTNAFRFSSVSDITFSGVVFRGPDNLGSGDEVSPLLIRSSSDITIVQSEFYNVWHGVKLLDVDGIIITGSYFHDIRTDGIRGGGVSNAVITNNFFTDFNPIGNDHPDAIQFWSTNQDEAGRNLIISDNLIVRGEGSPIQGIFIRDTFDTLPFENVSITGNIVLGGLYNGISVGGLIGGEITNNIVAGYEDQRSWIRLGDGWNVVVNQNSATAYSFQDSDEWRRRLNDEIEEGTTFAEDAFDTWSSDDSNTLADLSGMLLSTAPIIDTFTANQSSQLSASSIFTTVIGTWGDDNLSAASGGSKVSGKAGNDVINGAGSDDILLGNWGDDVLRGNAGNDVLVGSGGDDTLFGNTGYDQLYGKSGDDVLIGGQGDDLLFGGMDNDNISGSEGDDKLFGGLGDDIIFGGDGNDRLLGGGGSDTLIGGLGADQFVFEESHGQEIGFDTILDFEVGADLINLKHVDANSSTWSDDAFTFISTAAFSGTAGELRLEHVANGIMVQGDVDGDGVADLQILVEGVDDLQAADFIF
jgi:Ca2+-binding RTX toxin-like protein